MRWVVGDGRSRKSALWRRLRGLLAHRLRLVCKGECRGPGIACYHLAAGTGITLRLLPLRSSVRPSLLRPDLRRMPCIVLGIVSHRMAVTPRSTRIDNRSVRYPARRLAGEGPGNENDKILRCGFR